MSRSNSLLASVFVVLLTVGVTRGLCTFEEMQTLLMCFTPSEQHVLGVLGTEKTCNRNVIEDELCSDFAEVVACTNEVNVSRTTCRPHWVAEIEKLLTIPCRIVDFAETCTEAPEIDYGD